MADNCSDPLFPPVIRAVLPFNKREPAPTWQLWHVLRRLIVLTDRRKCSRHQDRVGNCCFDGTVFLALPSCFEPFRILQESSKFLFALSQRFPLQNQEQIIARLSNRYSPEPELFDSMFFEQPQRASKSANWIIGTRMTRWPHAP
jgi:hypothetical protein